MEPTNTPQQEQTPQSSWWDSISTGLTEIVQIIETSTSEMATTINESIDYYLNEGMGTLTEDETQESDEKKKAVENIFERASANWENQIIEIWSRDAKNLSIHIDLPRLVNKITAYGPNKEIIFQGNHDTQGSLQVCPFIRSLKTYFNDQSFPVEQLEENIIADPDVASNALENLFSEQDFSQSALVNLLKAIHQQILFPAYYKIKHIINSNQTKDKANTWTITIEFNEDGSVNVIHRKTQVIPSWALNENSSNDQIAFTFTWQLKITFVDISISSIKEVTCGIIEGKVDESLLSPEKANLFKSLIPQPSASVSNSTENQQTNVLDVSEINPTSTDANPDSNVQSNDV